MATNKERIEQLEAGLGGLQDGMSRMELGLTDKLHQMEETIHRLSEALLSNKERSSSNTNDRNGRVRNNRDNSKGQMEGGQQMFLSKLAKLEFPKYSGNDPTEWFNKVDQFFEYQGIPAAQKVSLASFHLEGEANQWWQWLRRSYSEEGKEVAWADFEEELWARFGPTECEDFDEALSRVKQMSSLRDYQREFEKLGNRVQGWTQKALVGTFMGSLKSEIADDIRMFKPKSLKEAISLARMRDDQLTRQRRFTRPLQPNWPQPDFSTQMKSKPTPTMKRLTWEEMQKRRAQGLCFNCDDKFTVGHKCRGPQLLLLEGNSSPNKEDDIDEEIEEPAINEQTEPEIFFHALTGWSTPKTMRITTKIGQHEVVVLIDSGSTHNFISEKVVDMLHLPVVPTDPFTVKVANGTPLKCQGRFEHVHVILQGIPFSLTLYSLPLTGLDLVLGVQWLEQLGTIVCNWKKLTMEFQWENQTHKLQGTNTQTIQVASLKAVSKELRQGRSMFAICLQSTSNEIQQTIHLDMQQLIKAFEDIFREPNQLPPAREIHHRITLKEGTEPVNVRPFRALNAVTIKDRFPIPTVDDMPDELHGATYFTKLDLKAGYHQVRVHPPDIPKTAFRTHNGHYEYLVMPFGLSNALSTFQAIMNSIFRPYLRKFVQHQFFVKISKCAFGQQELEYLGLTGYYRKFVRNYGIIARALTNLLKKGKFAWTKDAETAFQALKQAMTSTPTLAMPNFNEPFVIESDASGDGIGVVLTQQGKPIAFMSRALGVSKRSWSIYAQEMLAIVHAIQTWRPYLLGRKFYIQTDQRSLKYLLEQRITTPEQQEWVAKLLGYDYEITYKPGRENSAADALSRVVSSPSLNALFVPQAPLWDEIKAEAIKHPYMDKIGKLATDSPGAPYTW
ncbi:Retrovirus-related Pol polyprotein from transposon 17.6 [Vitis vinifera]|uniref:Retrovirus-related Pol polyprotein from transposon 17.6 n=1 Tax=Vitis vinifera TaxID=29760 RepID=A0A438I8Q4_VITVI|nr:Retrovirus-related Pol polyprotein from transposon 17.6 [Vitis vinifera]